MIEYKKLDPVEDEEQRYAITRSEVLENTTTTTLAQEEAIVSNLKEKLKLHKDRLKALKAL